MGAGKEIDNLLNIKYIRGDLASYSVLEEIVRAESPDYIMNLIGSYRKEDIFRLFLEKNALISKSIFEVYPIIIIFN